MNDTPDNGPQSGKENNAGKKKDGKDKASAGLRRSMARMALVQALFQIEFNKPSERTVLDEFLSDRIHEDYDGLKLSTLDQSLFIELYKGIRLERELLDDMLRSVLDKDWPLERIDPLLAVIMRAGAYEIQERLDIPARVVISEYVDIANAFFGGKETAMVNGILDRLAHGVRKEEFEK